MGSEDGGHQPPFSPIGIRHASTTQEDTTSGNVSDQERVTIVDSSPLVPPRNVQHLWRDVANLFDTQKQVIWRSAVESLSEAHRYLRADAARLFVENYMKHILGILLDQVPSKLGPMERSCVEDSLKSAVLIVFEDLSEKVDSKDGECVILDVLSSIFNPKRNYYKSTKANNWNGDTIGLPKVREHLIAQFKSLQGFKLLGEYFSARTCSTKYPSFDIIHILLHAAADSISLQVNNNIDIEVRRSLDNGVISFGRSVMDYIYGCSEDTLKRQSHDNLSELLLELQRVYERFAFTRRDDFHSFFDFLRRFALKLITSQSLPLRLYGWETVKDLVDIGSEYRPPPRAFRVLGAGCDYVNGIYECVLQRTEDGYVKPRADLKYELRIPGVVNGADGTAKQRTLTLFRCTMRSQQKWWFLSEADEAQPGTDKDVDYYQHKSRKHEELMPPLSGWITSKSNGSQGIDPPPNLVPIGLVTAQGEEFNTLEHQLARWAVENNVVEIMLGDSIHREIVARSVPFILFLANMCSRDDLLGDGFTSDPRRNAYGLRASHLKLAWRICTNKLDAAVSTEVLQMLVCILPHLPEDLAILFLNDVQHSLTADDNLLVVAEFCSSLASLCNSERERQNTQNSVPLPSFTDNVRLEVLKLLWNILNHPDASSLKCYEIIKDFVSTELRIEPLGTIERSSLLRQCKESLSKFSAGHTEAVDELSVMKSANLTLFVLEACPLEQSIEILSADSAAFPAIIFDELVAYLQRLVKSQSHVTLSDNHSHAILNDRLFILRYVYGISECLSLTVEQLDTLWDLCIKTSNIEAFLVFLAYSSVDYTSITESSHTSLDNLLSRLPQWNNSNSTPSRTQLTAAFSTEIKEYVFQQFFCSTKVLWSNLGLKAYLSFSFLHSLRIHMVTHSSIPLLDGPAVDALWRICLESSSDTVASQAMTDLLSLYMSSSVDGGLNGDMDRSMDSRLGSFADRIYEVLNQVCNHILTDTHNALRSAERCCKILLTAVVHDAKNERGTNLPTIPDFSFVDSTSDIHNYLKLIPHGLRGQSCYRTISVLARRTQNQVTAHPESPSGSNVTLPPSQRFSMQIHPLEPLRSIKKKIAKHCEHDVFLVRPISFNGRRATAPDQAHINLNVESDDTTVSSMGIVNGSEIVVLLAHPPISDSNNSVEQKRSDKKDRVGLPNYIFGEQSKDPNRFYDLLLKTVDALLKMQGHDLKKGASVSQLFWDLLSSIPTNVHMVDGVRNAAHVPTSDFGTESMMLDSIRKDDEWSILIDANNIQKSVYILQIIDSFLNPASEIIENAPPDRREIIMENIFSNCSLFRNGFIETGGLDAVIHFFTRVCTENSAAWHYLKIGHSFILRILKSCFTGTIVADIIEKDSPNIFPKPDNVGRDLMKSLSDPVLLLKYIVVSIIRDSTASEFAVADALLLTRVILTENIESVQKFASLDNGIAEKFTILCLLWKSNGLSVSSLSSDLRIRQDAASFILEIPTLLSHALGWVITALENLEMTSESCSQLFSVLIQVVETRNEIAQNIGIVERLCYVVCVKLAMYPRRSTDDFTLEYSTDVLCGCLRLLQALVIFTNEEALGKGVNFLLDGMRLSDFDQDEAGINVSHKILLSLIQVIFERFFVGDESRGLTALCSDNNSRHLAFSIILAAAEACQNGNGFVYLSQRIETLIDAASPSLLHRWGLTLGTSGQLTSQTSIRSKYSGLRNQGCTCYMNSVLQQLFMMPRLQKKLCSATLPSSLRSSNVQIYSHGHDIIGKKIVLAWENGHSYEAVVEDFDERSGCHKIRYLLLNASLESRFTVPEAMLEEFKLFEGRPGKETGSYVLSQSNLPENLKVEGINQEVSMNRFEESSDEIASRHLLEEVQRIFVHLEAGSRGRCFDPRTFVEACACLKLEFDVWQQNDASEFAMKLLDRLEPALKRWSPEVFKYVENTFRLKQTKQKICKECGMKTNREESFMSIDCQIRGKSDIHEALASMCEVEYMEGDNKVYCDQCKKKCDTILRTAISALPDVLILSLKRFDLDYNTFETVKLNSRCAFGHTLNVKKYTLEGVEATATVVEDHKSSDVIMDTDESQASRFSDSDYDYRLVGVLVHAGVAQGGHYYSLIKDRSLGSNDTNTRWFKFDDEDVTAFDQSAIETECFGGKVKKETKWPNGQVQVVESEQFANALMLFYEKLTPTRTDDTEEVDCHMDDRDIGKENNDLVSGYDAFLRDVRRSNTTHSQHSFMFDQEFQSFLRRCLDDLSRNLDNPSKNYERIKASGALERVLNTCISYYFDVLLHSRQSTALGEWTRKLADVLTLFKSGSRSFLFDLANRTVEVRRNWIRTFLADCPDDNSRSSAVKIFLAAFQSYLSLPHEVTLLRQWTECLTDSLKLWRTEALERKSSPKPPPSFGELLSHIKCHSPVGIIILYAAQLLDIAPQIWRSSIDLFDFVKEVASLDHDDHEYCVLSAVIESLIPPRLVCLILRELTPQYLKAFFPKASMSSDMVRNLVKTESKANNPLPIQPVTAETMNHMDTNSSMEISFLLEAIAAVLNIKPIPAVYETGEIFKGKRLVNLTQPCMEALATVYREWSTDQGMGPREIIEYMNHCGLDFQSHHALSILHKYGTQCGSTSCLSVEGFISLYRDFAQSDQDRVLHDLYICGYRPNLTRRPESIMVHSYDGQANYYEYTESVALDIAMNVGSAPQIDELTSTALLSWHLFSSAFLFNFHLATYFIARCCYEKDTTMLITDTLRTLYRTVYSWNGSNDLNTCSKIFGILTAIPDKYQKDRIAAIMMCTDRVHASTDVGCGLLVMGQTLNSLRPNQSQYSMEYRNYTSMLERYIEVLKDLQKQREVSNWIAEFRLKNNWVDHLLSSSSSRRISSDSIRRKDEGGVIVQPSSYIDANSRQYEGNSAANSDSVDSDGHADLNYSEEDDDSRYDPAESTSISFDIVTASGAGYDPVNGAYSLHGTHDEVKKFRKFSRIQEREQAILLYRCKLTDGNRRWYISIVPDNFQPGTNKDIDFYYAPATGAKDEMPPTNNWSVMQNIKSPAPKLSYTLDEDVILGQVDPTRQSDYC